MKRLAFLAFVGFACVVSPPEEVPDVPGMKLDPGAVGYSYDANPGAAEVFKLAISNTGDYSFDWTDVTASAWLTVAPTSGSLQPGEDVEVDVTVDVASLPDGLSSASVKIEAEWDPDEDKLSAEAQVSIYIDAGLGWIIVDGVSGDDDTGDGTVANPYKTITKGLTEAGSADTVFCLPATYEEAVILVEGIALVGSGAQGCVVDAGVGPSVIAGAEITAATSLSGFTVTGDSPADGEGAAMTCEGSPAISGCEFASCHGSSDVATVIVKGTAAPTLTGCKVLSNYGGIYGIACLDTSSPTISGCEMDYNRNSAVLCTGDSTPLIEFCEFTSNSAAAVCVVSYARPVIDANTFSGNAQGLALAGDSFSVVINNVITDCASGLPGVASADTATAALTNNTIVFNDEGVWWGSTGTWSLDNNIIYHNYMSQWSKGATSIDPSPYRNNCIEGFTEPGGVNNFWFPPTFLDKDGRDLRLSGGPCQNSGEDAGAYLGACDRDGNARIMGGTVDRGAYEVVE